MDLIAPKVRSWASILEWEARNQAIESSSLEIVPHWVALLPDVHYGKGSTVGSVLPTRGGIIPAAVGVDIGCGMSAIKLDLQDITDLPRLRGQLERDIPRGEGRNGSFEAAGKGFRQNQINFLEDALPTGFDPDGICPWWREQVGTLGGGNHFLEVDRDEEGFIWLTLHSGSRGVGLRVAEHHIKLAQAQGQDLPNKDLAWFEENTPAFEAYIDQMMWCQTYAKCNRQVMQWAMIEAVSRHVGGYVEILESLDCHHNYTTQEEHYGEELWVTRKGAIRARTGDLGLIPGSMGTTSYIVEGKGYAESFTSAPHGAGRVLSRRKAKNTLDFAEFQAQMAGIECHISEKQLDEAPGAYKPIDVVLNDARDMIEVRHTLTPILNIKG